MSDPDNSPGATSQLVRDDPSVELSSNRTSLSFERTRMSADRTLMSTVRTALSLISFGFTIYQVFQQMKDNPQIMAVGTHSARYFGASLVLLGVAMLVMGIIGNWHFSHELTKRRERLYGLHLLRRTIQYTATPTFIIACALLVVGGGAVASIFWRAGPFS